MKKRLVVLFTLLTLVLTGCMYPEAKLVQNAIPFKDQVQSVQTAVIQFQKDNEGILPVRASEETTPIYQKYPIDFKRLVPKYMAEPPENAFESGGVFQYVIVNTETDPQVKIFDLRMADMISEIKLRIQAQGYPPFKGKISDHVFTLDFNKLGYEEEPYVVSPYTKKHLSFVINEKAEIFVDYRSDLAEMLNKEKYDIQLDQDIRDVLWQDSLFVPAFSLPYTVDEKTKEPIFFTK